MSAVTTQTSLLRITFGFIPIMLSCPSVSHNFTVTQSVAPSRPFGDSESPYSVVQTFYSFWCNYTTKKTFAWKDQYKPSDMPDRQQRRAAERFNEKERQQGKREYNSTLKDLIDSVRRRDPRVKAETERLSAEAEKREAAMTQRTVEALKRKKEQTQQWAAEAAAVPQLSPPQDGDGDVWGSEDDADDADATFEFSGDTALFTAMMLYGDPSLLLLPHSKAAAPASPAVIG